MAAVTSDSSRAYATPAAQATPAAVALHARQPRSTSYGQNTIVRGSTPASAAGVAIELKYRSADAKGWRTVAHGHVHKSGHFALSARVERSGSLQVVATPPSDKLPSAVSDSQGDNGSPAPLASVISTPGATVQASAVRHLTVKPELSLTERTSTAVAGQTAHIRGRLLPGVGGRLLELDVKRGTRWVRAVNARTGRGGAFDIRFLPGSGTEKVQVAFAGDRLNSRTRSAAESVSAMQDAEVSWYNDAGNTACGFHATYGIASRTLPCGTKVTLSSGSRTVVATVDDRGPFVYSRLYDLNQNVAGALGMWGVGTVQAST